MTLWSRPPVCFKAFVTPVFSSRTADHSSSCADLAVFKMQGAHAENPARRPIWQPTSKPFIWSLPRQVERLASLREAVDINLSAARIAGMASRGGVEEEQKVQRPYCKFDGRWIFHRARMKTFCFNVLACWRVVKEYLEVLFDDSDLEHKTNWKVLGEWIPLPRLHKTLFKRGKWEKSQCFCYLDI